MFSMCVFPYFLNRFKNTFLKKYIIITIDDSSLHSSAIKQQYVQEKEKD